MNQKEQGIRRSLLQFVRLYQLLIRRAIIEVRIIDPILGVASRTSIVMCSPWNFSFNARLLGLDRMAVLIFRHLLRLRGLHGLCGFVRGGDLGLSDAGYMLDWRLSEFVRDLIQDRYVLIVLLDREEDPVYRLSWCIHLSCLS